LRKPPEYTDDMTRRRRILLSSLVLLLALPCYLSAWFAMHWATGAGILNWQQRATLNKTVFFPLGQFSVRTDWPLYRDVNTAALWFEYQGSGTPMTYDEIREMVIASEED
jgi:hypothetical protein